MDVPDLVENRNAGQTFRFRYLLLIFLTWNIPPVFGFLFLIYIDMLSVSQAITILTSPIEPVFIVAASVFSLAYFYKYGEPLFQFEISPTQDSIDVVKRRMKQFPVHYWSLFLAYLLMAPSTVIISAELYTSYVAQPVDWFRIHLVALIVSIVVGLPLFFMLLDNFGRLVGSIDLKRPFLTIRAKVFLIGALTPLLIDTMLVQYYWSRTNYFTIETFWVWLSLELLAISGALVFMKSFSQSIEPLSDLLKGVDNFSAINLDRLRAKSTDELGVLAGDFHSLVQELNVKEEILGIRNRILTKELDQDSLEYLFEEIVSVADKYLDSDITFIVAYDQENQVMKIVCYSDHPYKREGYTSIDETGPSLAALAFNQEQTIVVDDALKDSRVNADVVSEFGIRSSIAVPLSFRDQKYGVLITCTQERLAFYQQRDVRLTEALAQEASIVTQSVNAHYQHLTVERELEVLFDNMQDTFFRIDRDGVILRLSGSVEELLGYPVDELIGVKMETLFVNPDGSSKFLQHLKENDGFAKNYQALMRRKGGEVVWIDANAQYYSDDEGNWVGFEGIARNITEQKKAESELFQEKEQAQVTLASIGDGVVTTNTRGKIVYINPVAEKMLGLQQEAVEGAGSSDVVVLLESSSRSLVRDPVNKCLSGRSAVSSNIDTILVSRDGSEYSVEYTVSPILDRSEQVIGAIMVLHDVTEMQRLSSQLSYQAKHDSLTGLINRHEFESRLDSALTDARESGEEHALCYMDLDQFKIVNDTCGHMAGDELLRQLATVLRKKVRKSDTLARLGGDEFGVLLVNCPLETSIKVADLLRQSVREFRFTWEGRSFDVGVSIGLVPIVEDSGSMTDLLTAADNVCYMAKDLGRDRIQVYRADDDQLARRYGETRWASRINEAIRGNNFSLYGQKIVSLKELDDSRERYEVLIRLEEGDGHLIPPMAFIPAAERYYLMPRVDRWVIRKSFEILASVKKSGEPGRPISYSINLSGQSLSDDGFLDYVVTEFIASGLEAGDICFEITETAAIANLSQAISFISTLRTHGCQFSLDDFGSGLSSFSYLKNLDVDYLKIDGSFVRDMLSDPIDREMVEAINRVGHVMGLKTIAEYVEDERTLDLLREQKVDFVQGFAVAEPVRISGVASAGNISIVEPGEVKH